MTITWYGANFVRVWIIWQFTKHLRWLVVVNNITPMHRGRTTEDYLQLYSAILLNALFQFILLPSQMHQGRTAKNCLISWHWEWSDRARTDVFVVWDLVALKLLSALCQRVQCPSDAQHWLFVILSKDGSTYACVSNFRQCYSDAYNVVLNGTCNV